MEGLIRVNRPLALQGYEVLTQGMFGFDMEKHKKERIEKDVEQIPTYLNVTVSTDPFIELPSENAYDYYPGGEPTNLLLHGS